jgi:hypothetical protein
MREKGTWLPWLEDGEYGLVPDIIVGEVAYVRTGIRDVRGRMILKRVSLPVGFTADHTGRPQYATDTEDPGEAEGRPAVTCSESAFEAKEA